MRIVVIVAFALAVLVAPVADTPAGLCCPPPLEVAWSPDGSRLAVAIPAAGTLLELSADGSTVRTVAVREGPFSPAWSPDGTQIAFSSGGGIHVIDASGRPAQFLSAGRRPVWSPDGETIAYTLPLSTGPMVALIGADGSGERRLAAGANPVWRPDGAALAFERVDEIWTTAPDGSDQRRVARGASSPLWSSDGSLAYAATDDGVHVLRPDGSARRLAREGGPLAWSPNGRRLAVVVQFVGVRSLDIRTGAATRLSQELSVRPSPDWTRLAIAVGAGSNEGLYVAGPKDSRPRRLPVPQCLGSEVCREGSDGADRISGRDSRDVLLPGAGADVVSARGGHDRVDAAFGNDVVYGGAGNDVLLGQAGDDRLVGGPDIDILVGGGGRDLLDGGDGNDTLDAHDDGYRDTIRCGPGRDSVAADRFDRVGADCERVVR